jgi:hypothetical protein
MPTTIINLKVKTVEEKAVTPQNNQLGNMIASSDDITVINGDPSLRGQHSGFYVRVRRGRVVASCLAERLNAAGRPRVLRLGAVLAYGSTLVPASLWALTAHGALFLLSESPGLVLHPALGLLVLIVITVLNVHKPAASPRTGNASKSRNRRAAPETGRRRSIACLRSNIAAGGGGLLSRDEFPWRIIETALGVCAGATLAHLPGAAGAVNGSNLSPGGGLRHRACRTS